MGEIEALRQEVDALELAMLNDPATIEQLRGQREAALARLAEATWRSEAERPPTAEQLYREWHHDGVKLLRRSQLTAGSKARLIRRCGVKLYRSLAW
jgi:hypothetical protein